MKTIPATLAVIRQTALAVVLAVIGCDPSAEVHDARLEELARQSLQEQARQNERLAEQARAATVQSERTVESSQQLIAAQERLTSQLNEQQARLDAGREQLEEERREIAGQRHRDPLVAAAISSAALLLACLLPLVVAGLLISRLSADQPQDGAIVEALVSDLAGGHPRLLPEPPCPAALQHAGGPQGLAAAPPPSPPSSPPSSSSPSSSPTSPSSSPPSPSPEPTEYPF